MSSRRSYLDTLNAGRQRRPSSALEELNRSLEGFEQRLDRHRDEASEFLRGPSRYGEDHPSQRLQDDYRYIPPRQHVAEQPYATPGADRARAPEESLATLGRIAVDLKSLRDEVRYQMGTGLRHELDALRRDIESGAQPQASDADLAGEFERLAGMIQSVAAKNDDTAVAGLRAELDQVRDALEALAREDAQRDQRWQAIEERMAAPDPALPAMESLHQRMGELGETLAGLPATLPLRAIEDRLRTLATAIDHFSRQERHGAEAYSAIEARLEEISRAIVATSTGLPAATLDPAPFERIEARIGALARQIEEVASVDATREVVERLNVITQRVDDLAQRADLPERSIEQLARQIAIIADKIEQSPAPLDAEQIFQGIDERFELLSRVFERRHGDASEHANLLFRELERRLDEVSDRLDQRSTVGGFDTAGMMESLDARLDQFARRIEARDAGPSDDTLARTVEARLTGIERKIDSAVPQFPGVDPDLIRNLEAQVAAISAHLMKPGQETAGAEVGPRLTEIERAIADNRQTVLDVAREAAEEVVRSFAGTSAESAAVKGLAEDLKTLEALTRRSDERNTRTFEAIHDTLLKVVDRLASLDTGDAPRQPASAEAPAPAARPVFMPPAAMLTIPDAPSIIGDTPAVEQEPAAPVRRAIAERTPAQAATAAAVAALGSEEEEAEAPAKSRSLFGGLSRAFSRRKKVEPVSADAAQQTEADDAAPAVSIDGPLDPKIANRPLEPGTGAPDLNAIIRRVRDERQPGTAGEADTAKSDFIAAARRAAQAAAAEADMLKKQSEASGIKRGSKLADLVKARRKPILMAAAAIMMALAGMQLGKSFLSGDPQVAAAKPTAPVAVASAEPVKAATAVAALEPEEPQAVEPMQDIAGSEDAAPVPAAVDTEPPGGAESTELTVESGPAIPLEQETAATATPDAPASTGAVRPGAAAETAATAAQTDEPQTTAIVVADTIGPVALRDAARGGDPKALFEVASRYAEGRGVTTDMANAARFYEQAAEAGFAPAQYRIGNFYEKGLGVDRDVAKAKTWYQMAAGQGNASAMHNLAVLFAMGADGVADNDSAARWFTEAAELGVKDSQFNLGILAAKGVGVPQNLEESYKWFALVAETGDRDATAKRDEIAKALRPEQLERARAAAELWRAKPVDPASNSVEMPSEWRNVPETTAGIDIDKAVRNIQALLKQKGYDAGSVDGKIGAKTRQAIAAFQRDNDLSATGEVDEKLVQVLLARE